MKLPWTYTKAFEHKSFEQSSKDTGSSVPEKSFVESAKEALIQQSKVPAEERWKQMIDSGLIDQEGKIILSSPEITLPPVEPVVEVVVPVEKPQKQKRKKRRK